jgi:hypothetical protein
MEAGMKSLLKLLPIALMLAYGSAYSQTVQKVDPASSLQQKAERGWFFYEDPVKLKEKKAPKAQPEQTTKSEPKPTEDECASSDTWTAKCGFVNPGTSFAFQAKQRDALMEQMVMSQNDPKAVEAFQFYMKWAMGRASEVANLWHYNMVQNPELDAQTTQPISTFGLKLMTDVKKGRADEIFSALQTEQAMLVYFTRSDCQFCHSMAPLVKSIATDTGLPVWNAALDETCLEGFESKCQAGEPVQKPAAALQVSIVPSLFLHVPPSTWIRLSTGVTDKESIMARTVSFFSAYRSALLKGINNGDGVKAAVDFSGESGVSGNAHGVTPAKTPKVPTQAEIAKFLHAE